MFQAAGNGAHGLLFQKLWAMLLLSLYPPSKATSCSYEILNQSSQIFQMFSYIIHNVDANGSNLLQYEVEYDAEEEMEVYAEAEMDTLRQSIANEVSGNAY